MRILVVEDDELVADGLKQGLQRQGYTVDLADSAEQAEFFVRCETFDMALIDLGLPKMDGLQLIRKLRGEGHNFPILVLTARGGMENTVQGLDAGADDYLTKPYRLPELAARMRALIRRSSALADACVRHDGLALDTRTHSATLDGRRLDLTRREWAILEMLLLASPAVVGKERLLQSLSGWDKDMTQNAVEVHVSRLRGKLDGWTGVIRTVRGIGYRIDAAA